MGPRRKDSSFRNMCLLWRRIRLRGRHGGGSTPVQRRLAEQGGAVVTAGASAKELGHQRADAEYPRGVSLAAALDLERRAVSFELRLTTHSAAARLPRWNLR